MCCRRSSRGGRPRSMRSSRPPGDLDQPQDRRRLAHFQGRRRPGSVRARLRCAQLGHGWRGVPRDRHAGTARIVVDESRGVIVGAPSPAPSCRLAAGGDDRDRQQDTGRAAWQAVPPFPTRSEIWLKLLERREADPQPGVSQAPAGTGGAGPALTAYYVQIRVDPPCASSGTGRPAARRSLLGCQYCSASSPTAPPPPTCGDHGRSGPARAGLSRRLCGRCGMPRVSAGTGWPWPLCARRLSVSTAARPAAFSSVRGGEVRTSAPRTPTRDSETAWPRFAAGQDSGLAGEGAGEIR